MTWQDESSTECQITLEENTVHHREPGSSAQQQADINSETYVVCIVSETVIIIKSMDRSLVTASDDLLNVAALTVSVPAVAMTDC